MSKKFRNRPCAWKGILSGLAGGLTATIVMTQFQNAWSKTSEMLNSNQDKGAASEKQGPEDENEDATMKAAGKIAALAGHNLSHETRKKLGPAIHYGFGTVMGAAYGLSMEAVPGRWRQMSPLVSGVTFGAALFLLADEFAVPALGLSKKASESPVSNHLYGLASHLVYGVTVAGVRSIARKIL